MLPLYELATQKNIHLILFSYGIFVQIAIPMQLSFAGYTLSRQDSKTQREKTKRYFL